MSKKIHWERERNSITSPMVGKEPDNIRNTLEFNDLKSKSGSEKAEP